MHAVQISLLIYKKLHRLNHSAFQRSRSLFHFCFLAKQEVVPSYLATSPILSDGGALMSSSLMGKSAGPPVQTLGATGSNGDTGSGGVMKKRRKRRRKARADSMRREESGDYSEDEDMFTIDISSDEGTEMESSNR